MRLDGFVLYNPAGRGGERKMPSKDSISMAVLAAIGVVGTEACGPCLNFAACLTVGLLGDTGDTGDTDDADDTDVADTDDTDVADTDGDDTDPSDSDHDDTDATDTDPADTDPPDTDTLDDGRSAAIRRVLDRGGLPDDVAAFLASIRSSG